MMPPVILAGLAVGFVAVWKLASDASHRHTMKTETDCRIRQKEAGFSEESIDARCTAWDRDRQDDAAFLQSAIKGPGRIVSKAGKDQLRSGARANEVIENRQE